MVNSPSSHRIALRILQWKKRGEGANPKVQEMSENNLIYIEPLVINDYQKFRFYAKRAELVTFETQYYNTPFKETNIIEPAQYLKALKIWAFGVYIDQQPYTLTHTIHFPWIPHLAEDWETWIKITSKRLTILTEELETDLQAIQGNPSPPSVRELWVKTLR